LLGLPYTELTKVTKPVTSDMIRHMLLTWGLTTSGVAIGFSKGVTQAQKARGIEVPKAPSRWGMGRGVPFPNGEGSGEWKCPTPESFLKCVSK